ncbi:uncharacterized protein LOC108669801 [Hyalella azteca]|uniref:Uncharacterized protein LOC108669801 n=1 Tax=Hyalella azteca TaxID=294128 RepID=A0A8B7NGF0_HYAAZ|nr:uncharacterized protein LOC108669801 [Hyalella azteca]
MTIASHTTKHRDKVSPRKSPLSILLKMWRRRCARVQKNAASITLCLLALLALSAVSAPDLGELCERSCEEDLMKKPLSPDDAMFIQYIKDQVLDPPQSEPVEPLTLDMVETPEWKDIGPWYSVMTTIRDIVNGIDNGTYVEVGSGDGELFSFSSQLEVVLGWQGLLIEPRPTVYQQARRTRKAAGANVCVAVENLHGKKFFWEPRNSDLSEILQKINYASATLLDHVTSEDRGDGELYSVQCLTLNSLIHAYTSKILKQRWPQLSLLVIDAHGAADMLSSLNGVQITMLVVRGSKEYMDINLIDETKRLKLTYHPKAHFTNHLLFIDRYIKIVYKEAINPEIKTV